MLTQDAHDSRDEQAADDGCVEEDRDGEPGPARKPAWLTQNRRCAAPPLPPRSFGRSCDAGSRVATGSRSQRWPCQPVMTTLPQLYRFSVAACRRNEATAAREIVCDSRTFSLSGTTRASVSGPLVSLVA